MASVETFESTLKDVVQAKRLSASKMSALTDIALKCMKNDTQLVSVLFRTHKSLSASAKISSLYIFDALSRAARNQVNKQGLTGDLTSPEGNCATFLLKVEGILDSLYRDLLSSGNTELKEKSKKILDIWVKSNTFPSAVLGRLSQYLKGAAEKEPDKVVAQPAPPADPRSQSMPTSSTTPPQAPPIASSGASNVQSTLLALLSQAANAMAATNSQTTTNLATSTPSAAPVLDANQLALFQRLTRTAKLGNGVPRQPIPLPVSLVASSTSSTSAIPVVPLDRGPLEPPQYRANHYGSARRESSHDTYGGPDRARDRDDYYDDRRDFRGGFRGGSRGRGRGRWDDRDRYSDRNREWTPPARGRRSRSRSPPGRYGGRRDSRPYSPPRRPSVSQTVMDRATTNPIGPSASDSGKDEFGRDIRAGSPETSAPNSALTGAASGHSPSTSRSPTVSTVDHISTNPESQQPVQGGTSSHSPPSRQDGASLVGLDTFDPTTFDPSSAASWEGLGKAWAVTHGYLPSEAELMQYTFTGGLMGGFAVPNQLMSQQTGSWAGEDSSWESPHLSQPGRGAWRGGRGAGDRGGGRWGDHGYGNGRNADYAGRQAFEEQNTNTVVHGDGGYSVESAPDSRSETSDSVDPRRLAQDGRQASPHDMGDSSAGGTGIGRMQRVGDKWVFVRTEATEVA